MAGFIGLKPEHFEYFVRRDDLELKEAVRNTMNLLASLVGKRMKEQYPEFRMGKISDICRISFFRGKKEGKVAHQTIKLSPYDFEVFANVETQPAVKRLRSNINSNNTTFEKILRELPEGYVVTLTDRVPCDHPRSYNYVRVFEHRTDYLKPERDPQRKGLDYLKSLFFKFTYPQFSIRWRFDKDCVVRRKGNFIEEIVKTMKELHPFVEFSNEGSRSSEFSPAR